MFYIGSNVMDWPLEAARGLADGHEICVHTWSHRYMTAFQSEDAFAELWYTVRCSIFETIDLYLFICSYQMNAIKLATGVTPTCWRPPFGDTDDRIRSIAKGLGLRTILWGYDSNDWQVGSTNVTPAQVDTNYQNLITGAKNGTFNSVSFVKVDAYFHVYLLDSIRLVLLSLRTSWITTRWARPSSSTPNWSLPSRVELHLSVWP